MSEIQGKLLNMTSVGQPSAKLICNRGNGNAKQDGGDEANNNDDGNDGDGGNVSKEVSNFVTSIDV